MNLPYGPARGLPAVVLAAAGLLATGCSGGGGDDGAAPSPDPSATLSAVASPAASSASPSPRATPSPPYPTGPGGCHQDRGWSDVQAAEWVNEGQIGSTVWTDHKWGHVRFDKSIAGFDGPVCTPIAVQVQYWKVTYRAPVDGSAASDGSPRYAFTTASLARTQVRVDGRSVRDVYAPKSVATAAKNPCVGYMWAIYTGGPLSQREMATDITTGGLIGQSISFPTKRVAYSQLAPPSAPQVCDSAGHPVGRPNPKAPGTGVPGLPSITLQPKTP
ncbi:hypothetical protein SAMN05216267_101284 [Actinacidiphila rubida]|uniref:Lipoprotein n=1 Tax=Actinacidiphila rubida TaxID=310780 RepID=A0A1H8KAP4_9ACTN|nr:hypothetical protein [Actinacidiphila rubida]SEN89777.1 hypothetical protein SAMN05216267_101284 [Actinacidiphila rubida]